MSAAEWPRGYGNGRGDLWKLSLAYKLVHEEVAPVCRVEHDRGCAACWNLHHDLGRER